MNIDANFISQNTKLKLKVLNLHWQNRAGHIGSSLSCIDLLHVILLKHKKENDIFILSKGHSATALYACLNLTGDLTETDLESFYKDGTYLPAHPAPQSFSSIPFATGSLGHGLPIACGIAKAKQLKNEKDKIFVLLSDGETNEGTTWESVHFAVQHKLSNLVVIIDKNKIQGFDFSKKVLGDTSKPTIFRKIGFDVYEIDGHNLVEIDDCLNRLKYLENNKPKLIIANTIKGHGVSFMENTIDWHYWPMSDELYQKAINEINVKE